MFNLSAVMLNKHKRAYLGIQTQKTFPDYNALLLKKKLRNTNNSR